MFPQLKLRYLAPAVFATSFQCSALVPLSTQSPPILIGPSCDSIYPLEIVSVDVEPSPCGDFPCCGDGEVGWLLLKIRTQKSTACVLLHKRC